MERDFSLFFLLILLSNPVEELIKKQPSEMKFTKSAKKKYMCREPEMGGERQNKIKCDMPDKHK